MSQHIVEFKNVSKKYPGREALHNVSFTLPRGKVIGLIGPNGSGKSTALKLMAGLLRPNAGQVLVNGEIAGRPTQHQHMAFLSDREELYPFYTIGETLAFYKSVYGDFDLAKAEDMLKFLQLAPDQKVGGLSKGNYGRLKMVLTISRRVPLLLLDEPLSGLDPMVRQTIIQSIISYFDPEQTILLSTHEVSEIEPMLDMAMLIFNGQLVALEDVETIRETHQQHLVGWMSTAVR
ncbi:ABC transporter ATP-binding protein [Tumebacillus permanentifrigoris]|uniref:ABC-2 type transport system ATP-binding protein n=1 Tax=Tumebacillus permanentifrigoris TaxID=378543 RepID=A0A316DSS5_9BACL|nr:ABC transporter ATP-binding protein [Tumebacillus permanentifrigoris]PWK09579.1 ABC-2 type transport system ATP-binding protein [Tumebacillus permanentifrigoris]